MEQLDSLIPGMSSEEYYSKAALRQTWREYTLPQKVHCVIEMQRRAEVLMRLRGKHVMVWQEDEPYDRRRI